jgi:uncharacterized protein YraI
LEFAMKLRPILAGAALLASLAVPSVASAFAGYTTANVHLRAGPGVGYPSVLVVPYGAPTEIYGCLSDWSWCDCSWGGARGWVSGAYLQAMYQAQPVYLPAYAPRIGVPVISFEFVTYWDRHYHGRPWYRDRDRWHDYWRERREDRVERIEDRQEVREDRRERREDQAERVEDRQEVREDRRERREDQADRVEDRQEVREDRRERREDRAVQPDDQQQETRKERRRDRRQDARQENRQQRGEGEECVTRPNGRVVCE